MRVFNGIRLAKVTGHRRVLSLSRYLADTGRESIYMAKRSAHTVFIPSAKILEQVPMRGELYGVRDELKSEIRSVGQKSDEFRDEFRSEIKNLDQKIDQVRVEFRGEVNRLDQKIDQFRDELKSDIRTVDQKVDALRRDLGVVQQDVATLKQDVAILKQEVSELKQQVARIDATTSRILTLLEEQRSDNRLVLEGHQLLWQKMVGIENQLNTKF